MKEELLREWKKVYETDLNYIIMELRDFITPNSLVLLEGPVGAGKTTFCKKFIEDGDTLSPSYSIISETRTSLHADFYRLESPSEVLHLELPMYLEDKEFFFCEWGKKYIHQLLREIPDDFKVFELEISLNNNAQDNEEVPSRNFSLKQILSS